VTSMSYKPSLMCHLGLGIQSVYIIYCRYILNLEHLAFVREGGCAGALEGHLDGLCIHTY